MLKYVPFLKGEREELSRYVNTDHLFNSRKLFYIIYHILYVK